MRPSMWSRATRRPTRHTTRVMNRRTSIAAHTFPMTPLRRPMLAAILEAHLAPTRSRAARTVAPRRRSTMAACSTRAHHRSHSRVTVDNAIDAVGVAFQPDGTPSFAIIRDTGVERATAITMNQNPIEWKSVSAGAWLCRVSSRWVRRSRGCAAMSGSR